MKGTIQCCIMLIFIAMSIPGGAEASRSTYDNGSSPGKLEQDIATYSHAITAAPSRIVLLNNRGIAFKNQGEFTLAQGEFDKALELDPDLAATWNNRCYLMIMKEDYTQALSDCNRALELDPGSAVAWNNRGLAWWGQDEPAKAITDYSRAIEIAPDFTVALINRAFGLTHLGKAEDAAKDTRKAQGLGWAEPERKHSWHEGQLLLSFEM